LHLQYHVIKAFVNGAIGWRLNGSRILHGTKNVLHHRSQVQDGNTFNYRKMGKVSMSTDTITITNNRAGKNYEVPIEHEAIRALELRRIKRQPDDFGLTVYDPASAKSAITSIDGEKGILRYRGYLIEELTENSTFLEVSNFKMAPNYQVSSDDTWPAS
jgi:hypothetical protein